VLQFPVIRRSSNSHRDTGKPRGMYMAGKDTEQCCSLFRRHTLITAGTYGHCCLSAIKFAFMSTSWNDRMIGRTGDGGPLRDFWHLYSRRQQGRSRGRQCQSRPESHYDIRVGVKRILRQWRFNDKRLSLRPSVRSPASPPWRRRPLANWTRNVVHLASIGCDAVMILLPCERCSNLKRSADRRYGKTLMTAACQRLQSLRRS